MPMKQQEFRVIYKEYESLEGLSELEKMLISKAVEIAGKAYAPYSQFPVGAAVLLEDGAVFAGNNQENIAYPSGTCAERTVLNYVHGNFPEKKIQAIAITALHSSTSGPVTPCGFCRQVLVEMEQSQASPLKVLLHKIGGVTQVFESAGMLLPLAFEEKGLKK